MSVSCKVFIVSFVSLMVACACVIYVNVTDDEYPSGIKVIIDTDAGGDDAVALLLTLSAEAKDKSNFEIIAITCTYGNTYERNVEENVRQILTIANRNDIPVYRGAEKPLLSANFEAGDYFGKNGLGDFEFDQKITVKINESVHASVAMVEFAKRHPGNLNVLTLGALTNVAVASFLDSNFTKNVNQFYVMGASVGTNFSYPTKAEFNFGLDPESNVIFFNSPKSKLMVLAPYEVTANANISLEWRMDELGALNSTIMQFLNKAEAVGLTRNSDWATADAISAATMIWPDLITEMEQALITPLLKDTETKLRGGVDVNYDSDTPNVQMIQSIDVETFQEKLLYYFSSD